jgi:hypothetical protein
MVDKQTRIIMAISFVFLFLKYPLFPRRVCESYLLLYTAAVFQCTSV